MQRMMRLVIYLTAFGLAVASCAPAVTPAATPKPAATLPTKADVATPAPTPKSAAEQPRYGGVLTVGLQGDPASLDQQQEATYQVTNAVGPCYSGVLQYDPLNATKIIGDLAESWETSSDGLTHAFKLHIGVKWHDGTTLTAEDIRWSLERHYKAPKGVRTPRADLFEEVSNIEAPDENTVRITMKRPVFAFIPRLAGGEMSAMYSRRFVEAKGDMRKDVMGSGPFKLKSYDMGSRLEVAKHTDYFVKGRPYLDGVAFYIIKDASTRFSAFRTGRILLTGIADASLRPSEAATVSREMPGKAVALPYSTLRYKQVLFNYTKGPTMDLRVRKAISLAIDRQKMVEVVAQGSGTVGGPMLPGSEWAIPQDELLKMPGYRQPKDEDRAEAKRLLAEAGYPNGFQTVCPVRQGRTYEDDAVFVQDQLAKVGIKMDLQIQEYAIFQKTRVNPEAFEMFTIGSAVRIDDPDEIARYWVTGGDYNFSRFNDRDVDELFARQARAMDRAERRKIALDLQTKLFDTVAGLSLYWEDGYMGVWLNVKDFKPGTGLYNNNKRQDVWLAK